MSVLELRVSVGRCPLSGQHVKCRQLPGNASVESLPCRVVLFLILD